MSNEFVWTDELVKEFFSYAREWESYKQFDNPIEQFKKSKSNKDWEIIKLIGTYGGHDNCVFMLNKATNYYVPDLHYLQYGKPNWTLDDVLRNHNGKIYSVKRLSDGEVFSVGDYREEGKIIEISFSENDGLHIHVNTNKLKHNYPYKIHELLKSKKVLFTTEDGKPIYEGDKVVLLNTKTWLMSTSINAPKKPFYGSDNEYKYFYDISAAKEYILLNEKLLSVNDVLSVSHISFDTFLQNNKLRLIELAQEQLNSKS